jgi:hypothetical protein
MEEKIICAAIWYKDLDSQRLLPTNISCGVVILGHRHGHCISTLVELTGLRTVQFGENAAGEHTQGFLTNLNRFVDRSEGREIAVKQNQIITEESRHSKHLFSEDIY